MYYARTNRAAHVGPSWESVRPSPRAPPSRRGSPRRSTSRCSLSLSGYLAGSVLAWRPSGTQVIRGFHPPRTRARDDTSAHHEVNARLASCASRRAFPCRKLSLRSFVLICSCSAVRCGWLVLMRIRIGHVPRCRRLPLLLVCFRCSSPVA